MKKFYAFMIMVAALAACTRAEQPLNETPDQPEVPATYTLTLQASKGTDTRGLVLNGNTLNAIWDGSEQVYVYLNDNTSQEIAILTPVQSGQANCVLRGDFAQPPVAGNALTLKLNTDNYMDQRGTLAYIGSHCDYAIATVTVTGVNEGTIETVEGAANFENQQAIVKFTLKDKATDAAISPSAFTIKSNGTEVATVTGIDSNSGGVLFVAIPAISGTIDLAATVGSDTYKYSRENVTFAAGEYYSITVKMTKKTSTGIDLSDESLYVNGLFTAQDGDVLTGTFPDASWKSRRIEIASGATVTLRDVTIQNQSIVYSALAMNSSATIILEGTNTVTSNNNSAGITIGGPGSTLTITGNGELTVTGGWHGAGIGTGNATAGANVSCGSIIISGGTIKAIGGSGAAGIGCGFAYDNSENHCGFITINGGNVEATGLDGGAGIGGGKVGSNAVGSCGDINISSPALVTAKMSGNKPPYSIGPSISGQCGTVTIYGTTYVPEPGGILSYDPLIIPNDLPNN